MSQQFFSTAASGPGDEENDPLEKERVAYGDLVAHSKSRSECSVPLPSLVEALQDLNSTVGDDGHAISAKRIRSETDVVTVPIPVPESLTVDKTNRFSISDAFGRGSSDTSRGAFEFQYGQQVRVHDSMGLIVEDIVQVTSLDPNGGRYSRQQPELSNPSQSFPQNFCTSSRVSQFSAEAPA